MSLCGKERSRNTILPAQFCYDPKGDLKYKVHFKKRKKERNFLDGDSVAMTPILTFYQALLLLSHFNRVRLCAIP